MATLKRSKIAEFVASLPKGKFVGIEFVKADGTNRSAQICFGVKNPSHVTKPGQGMFKGDSFYDALEKGTLKFFEPNVVNKDGTKGSYRSAKIERIKSFTYGEKYTVID